MTASAASALALAVLSRLRRAFLTRRVRRWCPPFSTISETLRIGLLTVASEQASNEGRTAAEQRSQPEKILDIPQPFVREQGNSKAG